ncbi:replication initiation protein [Enterococcus faecalis]|uniref:replication initiation protein n=1 Tax=Enterococcus TaxID=1350 RepID=UPI001E2B9C20|nr:MULTISPECIES: replication initiation protein [Enterococcus]MCD4917841.1 replication initiation protein [Enterococcus faecalis]WCG34443.1 replication initiation protein [Enterococcus dispar]
MTNEIVKYENRLNDIPLRNFSPVEMNLFFSIASRVRDKGSNEVVINFNELKDLSKYNQKGERFIQDLSSAYDKLLSINAMNDDGDTLTKFVAFRKYSIVRSEQVVKIAVNEDFKGLFNQLSTWTRFNLEQFVRLDSTYSKTMFRLLKQFRTTGFVYYSKEEFFHLLDIPETYWNKPSNVDTRVLKPIKEELTPIFRGLTIKKKYSKGRGKPVVGYQFAFKAEAKNADDFSKGEHEDLRQKIFNIEHNGDLSQEEKWVAKDKVLNLKIGTHESDFYAQKQKEFEKIEEEKLRKDILDNLKGSVAKF